MKTLYFDCFAGVSGNMILGALVSLGVDSDALTAEIEKLNIGSFELSFSEVKRAGISSIHAATAYEDQQVHRNLAAITSIIEGSGLSDIIKERSISVFRNLAQAEASVHGVEVDEIHFHEVGAVDAIIDVVGACTGFEMLGIEEFACSSIHTGKGFVEIEHGKYPVPPPAVLELLKDVPVYSTEIQGELATPTGAAIVATVCQSFGPMPNLRVERTGYGAGTRDYDKFPNVLRMIVGLQESAAGAEAAVNHGVGNEDLTLIETNLDDVSPEILGFVMERAFELGALDCWFTPIQMKKNRPATKVSILTRGDEEAALSELLFSETSTLGVRIIELERKCLDREITSVDTEFGEVDVKIARYENQIVNVKPEYESVKRISVESGLAIKEIEARILEQWKEVEGEQ